MDIKERIEAILGSHITDEQLGLVQRDYKSFYEEPEAYVNAGIIDVICDDLNLPHPSQKLDIQELCNKVPSINMKHKDPYNSLAWGTYKDHPVYAMLVTGQNELEALGSLKDEVVAGCSDDDLVMQVAVSSTGDSAIVVVMSYADEKALGVMPLSEVCVPGYEKTIIRPLFVEDQPSIAWTYFVPFVKSGTGRNPVMWVMHTESKATSKNDVLDRAVDKYQDFIVGVDEDNIKDAYSELKTLLPGVDLESASAEERYIPLQCGDEVIVYNRNHLAYNGNLASTEAMMPWISLQVLSMESYDGNVADVARGNDFAVRSVFYRNGHGQPNLSAKSREVSDVGSISRAEVGPVNASRQRGEGAARTPLGKMLQNASSDYMQV